ncbi:MAG: efflux RND transporter permease subunit [Candidatus Eremiobacteraeota bacterium]|nr:efflux RND transporter permease subunit [Candidatus Eremiobacteraeota bacterium]
MLDSLTLVFNPLVAIKINVAAALLVLAIWGIAKLFAMFLSDRHPRAAKPFVFVTSRWRSLVFTAVTCLLMCLPFLPFPKIGAEFIPPSENGVLRGSLTYHIGQPLSVTSAAMAKLERELLKIDGVSSVLDTVGAKPSGFGSVVGGHVARFSVVLDKNRRKETDRVLAAARKLYWVVPGAAYHVAGEGGNPIAFTLTGPDVALEAAANQVVALLKEEKGTINAQSAAEAEGPRLNIHIDPARAAILGVSPGQAALAARIAIGGVVSTKVRLVNGLTDVRLELPVQQRNSLATIQQVRLRATGGQMIPLASVADFTQTIAPTKIERLNRERVIRVTSDIDPQQHVAQGDIVTPVVKKLNTPGFLPSGVRYITEGDTDLFQQAMIGMGIALITSVVLVYMLMVVLYGSFIEPAIVMFSVPVAIIGALGGLAVSHQTINLFSMIAIVMLFGLVSKNGILLVDYANQQRKKGLDVFASMKEAAHVRFRPILMTTFAMIFGMLPLSLGLTEGAETRRSMGTVLIGGLMSSLILTLVLVPVMYTWIMGWKDGYDRRKAAKRAMRAEHEVEEVDQPVPLGAH